MLTELTIKEFIHKVISNDPVPGGGSVSASMVLWQPPSPQWLQPDHRTEEIRRSKRSYGRPFRPF